MTGGSGGWHADEKLFFRCIQCGTLMRSTMVGNWQCPWKSMGVDVDHGRSGSRFGDRNVLVYERIG
jgi:hypothetical protein